MNKQKRPGLFLQIAGVLLCLCMISAHFTTGLYAKYTNRAQGSDAARAAKFKVSITDVTGPENLNEDLSGVYTLTVHNESEVAVKFKLDLIFGQEGLKILAPAADDGSAKLVKDGSNAETLILTQASETNVLSAEYQKATMLAAGDSVELTINVKFDANSLIANFTNLPAGATLDDKSGTFDNTDMSSLTGSFPFDVNATFIQID